MAIPSLFNNCGSVSWSFGGSPSRGLLPDVKRKESWSRKASSSEFAVEPGDFFSSTGMLSIFLSGKVVVL